MPEIYEATVNPSHWSHVLEMVAELTCSSSTCLYYHNKALNNPSTIAQFGCPVEMTKEYEDHFGHLDPLFDNNGEITLINGVTKCQQFYPGSENFADVADAFYKKWMEPHNIYYFGGVRFIDTDNHKAAIAIQRHKKEGPWSKGDMRVIDEIVPHLKRALNIHTEFTRLRTQQDSLLKGLDRLVIGLILFDRHARAVYINPTARAIIKGHPGLDLNDNGLFLNHTGSDVNLQQTILNTSKISPENSWKQSVAIGITHPDVKAPLPLLVTPMHAHQLTSDLNYEGAKVAVFLSDPNQDQPISVENLCSVYDLTNYEAQVAIGIANGQSIDEIATGTHRSTHTIRSQLKSVFKKTGVSRQSELIKLLLTGPFAHRRRSAE